MASSTIDEATVPGVLSVSVLFLVWAFLLYLTRLGIKLAKKDRWGMDGTVVSLAMAASVAHVAAFYYAVTRGYGYGWTDRVDAGEQAVIEKAIYTAQVFFVLSIGLTRTSTALFTGRILVQGQRYRRLATSIVGICGLSSIGLILVIAIRSPVVRPWVTVAGSQSNFTRWLIIEIIGLIMDCSILLFSVIIVWRLQMSIGKRLTVCSLFAIRLLIIPVVACRLWQLRPSSYIKTPNYNDIAAMLTEAELQLYIILASATCLKPLLQPFHPGLFTATDTNLAYTGYTTNPKSGSQYYELSGKHSRVDRSNKQPDVHAREFPKDDDSDQIDLLQSQIQQSQEQNNLSAPVIRPIEGENWSRAVAGSPAGSLLHVDRDRIQTTRTFAVQYEKRNPSEF